MYTIIEVIIGLTESWESAYAANSYTEPWQQAIVFRCNPVEKTPPFAAFRLKRENQKMARVIRSEDERLIIAYHIRQLSDQYNTNAECADKFGVPASQWSAWVNGRRTPEDERLPKIADFLGTSVEELKTAPPNWEEEKAKMQQRLAKKKGKDAAIVPEQSTHTVAKTSEDDGTDDYIQIVTALAKVQARYNKGRISQDRYESSMKSIREFIDFSYRDIAP